MSDSPPAAIEVLAPPVEVPTLGTLELIALALLLGWVALRRASPI